jgi:hypothetical protein
MWRYEIEEKEAEAPISRIVCVNFLCVLLSFGLILKSVTYLTSQAENTRACIDLFHSREIDWEAVVVRGERFCALPPTSYSSFFFLNVFQGWPLSSP